MTTTIATDTVADPHGLARAGEPLATESELHDLFGVGPSRLRLLRRRRLVRYIDHHPGMPAGTGPADRYSYAVSDVERARPSPPPSPKPPEAAPKAPAPKLPGLPMHTAATLRGPMPEVIVMRRRAGGKRP